MKTSQSKLFAALILICLAAASAPGQCVLYRYWPMNDGDDTTFASAALGVTSDQTFGANGTGFVFSQIGVSQTGTANLSYSGQQVLMSQISALGYTFNLDNDLIFLDENILNNGGSVTSSASGSILSATISLTLKVTVTKTGTVVVPAGSYANCVSVSWTLTVSGINPSTGQSITQTFPLNAFVLAPGVGVIRAAVFRVSGRSFTQAGWEDLTGGQVGGVPVASLAGQSVLSVPKFTLQPKSTVATVNGVAILKSATTGGSVSYQWQKDGFDLVDGGNIGGATSSNLVISPVQYSDQGQYSVTIVNPVCTASSTNALLSVVADTQPPTVTILTPPNKSSVSNSLIQASGRATDNVAVDHVNVWLDSPASGAANGTTNWQAALDLTPGPHWIFAQAVDLDGNVSKIASNLVTYILAAPLTVITNGKGSISPALNNVSLQIGASYSLLAAPGKGFKFISWTDGDGNVLTNKPALKFQMLSNLVLVANFADTNLPTLTITSPTATAGATTEFILASGKAADNAAVAGVFYNLNNMGWFAPNTTNHWANWSITIDLTPGTNYFTAYAIDTTGNVSPASTVKFIYSTAPAMLNGLKAMVTPDTSPAFDLALGPTTFSQISLDANHASAVGNFSYIRQTSSSGVLKITYAAPPSATNAGLQTYSLAFSAPGVARYTRGLETGGMVFTSTPTLGPSTLLNQTAYYVNHLGNGKSTVFSATKTVTTDLITHVTNTGAASSYTRYSPVGALLKRTGTNGAVYAVLTYFGTNYGTGYSESYAPGGNLSGMDAGVFGIASQRPGGNAPTNLVNRSALVTSVDNQFKLMFQDAANFTDLNPLDETVTNGVGTYDYARITNNIGGLDLNYVAPAQASSAVFQFIAPNFAVFTNADSTVGAATFK